MAGTTLLIYEDEDANLPEDVVCLQFASLSAKCGVAYAFMLLTPLRILELQTDGQNALETWSDTILSLQVRACFGRKRVYQACLRS